MTYRVLRLGGSTLAVVLCLLALQNVSIAECRETCTDYTIGSFVSDPNTTYKCCYVGGLYQILPEPTDPSEACDERHDPEMACPNSIFWYDPVGCWLGGDETANKQCDASAFTRTFKRGWGDCVWTDDTVTCVPTTNPADPGVQVTKFECADCEE